VHLALLERDGIVRQRGSVRRGSGGGKPAYVYELTTKAEDLFPKAYEPALRQLLDVLAERLGPGESEALLRTVGRALAEGKSAAATVHTRSARGGGRPSTWPLDHGTSWCRWTRSSKSSLAASTASRAPTSSSGTAST
jgi:hypothetical protein